MNHNRNKKLSHAGITWFVYFFIISFFINNTSYISFSLMIISMFLTIGNFIIVELMESNDLKKEQIELQKKKRRRTMRK